MERKLYLFQPQFPKEAVEFGPGICQTLLDGGQLFLVLDQVNGGLLLRQRDVAGDIEVVVVLYDFTDADPTAVPVFGVAGAIGLNDFIDVFLRQGILLLVFIVMLCGIDEEHVVGLAAFLEHDDADGNAADGRVRQSNRCSA